MRRPACAQSPTVKPHTERHGWTIAHSWSDTSFLVGSRSIYLILYLNQHDVALDQFTQAKDVLRIGDGAFREEQSGFVIGQQEEMLVLARPVNEFQS